MRGLKGLAFIFFFLCYFCFLVYADGEIVLCEKELNGQPEGIADTFQTGKRIYAFVSLNKIENGVHKIGYYWYNKNHKLQESYISEIKVINGSYRTWSWLILKDGLFMFDGSFEGKWKIRVLLDGNLLAEKEFSVV